MKPNLFIEGLDFLLATSESEVTPHEILTFLSVLSEALSWVFHG